MGQPTRQPPLFLPLFPHRRLATRRARRRSPTAARARWPRVVSELTPSPYLTPRAAARAPNPSPSPRAEPLAARESAGPPSSPLISSTPGHLASLQHARELPPPPAVALRPFGAPTTISPSVNLIGAPPSPPSLVRTAARTHPSSLWPLSPPLTYPIISLTYRVDTGLPPPSRVVLHRQNAAASASPRHLTDA
jgi:hypothetical protein